MLFTEPEFTSACVIVYVAVHVVDAPGWSVVTGHVTAPTLASVMPTLVRVCAPVFVTRNEYAIVSPVSTRPFALTSTGAAAVLSRKIARIVDVGVVVVDGVELATGPVGGVP